MRFQDKVVLITGAGRGIGREIALAFSREGANVVIADIDDASAQAVAREAGLADGRSLALKVDVGDPEQVQRMVDAVEAKFGRLDVMVNNAGIGHARPFLEIELGEWDRVLRTNLTGVFLCAQAAARVMTRQGAGRIINLGSISGQRGGAGRAAYGAAKAGVILLTKVMALELAASGILVNCVSPGPTETDQVRECHDDATRQSYYDRLPLKRYAHPSEIAAAVVFLASSDSSFVNGHILNTDGGFDAAGLMF